MTPPDALLPSCVQEMLASSRLGRRMYYYPDTGSTNDVAAGLARAGEAEGTVVVAERQRAGRGRLDHAWESTPGRDILFSVVLRPGGRSAAVLPVTLAISAGLSMTLSKETGADVGVKWPNDLLCSRGKVAGILAEAIHRGGQTDALVLGVGVNVNSTAADLGGVNGAVSCRVLSGREHDRAALLADLLVTVETWYDRFMRDGFAPLASAYDDRLVVRGRPVTFLWKGSTVQGTVLGVGEDGALAVSLGGGETVRLRSESIEETR